MRIMIRGFIWQIYLSLDESVSKRLGDPLGSPSLLF